MSTEKAPEKKKDAPKPKAPEDGMTQLQALLSNGATHRALIISHTPAEGETYDVGRRYAFHTLESDGGKVTLKPQQELEPGGDGKLVNDMPFHVAFDWLWKRLNDWLKPRQYR